MIKAANEIIIKGAYENNLKNIDLCLPKGELIVFAGPSGSGKSSLAFGVIADEARRQWQENYPLYVRNKMPRYERAKVESIEGLTPALVLGQRAFGASGRSSVGTALDVAPLLRLLFSRVGEPSAGGSMAYSFNHPLGMCPHCTGAGRGYELDEERLFDPQKTLREGGIRFSQFSSGWQAYLYQNNSNLNPDKKLSDFSQSEWNYLKFGEEKNIKIEIRSNNTGRVDKVEYEGVIPRFKRLYLNRDISKLKKSLQDEILSFVSDAPCLACGGSGLNPAALASKINGKNIVDFGQMSAGELLAELAKINNPMGASLARQISSYLAKMIEAGVGYLALSRRTDTLSGGEMQRVKMARALGGSLTNITYVFDEPTAGLHPSDAHKIGKILLGLRDAGNTVLVVEHNRQIIEIADRIVELGEGAGENGGKIVFEGSLAALKKANTKTAASLSAKIYPKENPREPRGYLEIKNACSNNLKNISLSIPKGVLTAICGVAGSGKSSLMRELVRAYPEAIWIDQKPLGANSRSTPATYAGVMDEIRKVFAKATGESASLFSYNSKGACKACGGSGKIVYEMAFAEPVEVVCEDCGGARYSPEALSRAYKGKNIKEIMDLTVDEALAFFDAPKIRAPLQALSDVGLGYLRLGHNTSAMSGGENQRLKLAAHLGRKDGLFVLDEPSAGLHSEGALGLLALFEKMVAAGNTVIIVEHRLELIARADHVVEMGEGGGSEGGEVVFEGASVGLLADAKSKTGEFLRRYSNLNIQI